jgi:hypothetical protein
METPMERMLERLPVEARKSVCEDIHTRYVIIDERKLMKMSYKIYLCDDLSR